jgi:integrase
VTKQPKLKYIKYVRAKGKLYAYFDTGKKRANGRRIWSPLPPPSTPGFYDSYLVMMGHRQRQVEAVATVAGLADQFERSPEFASLAMGTQKLYTSTLKRIREQLGKFPLHSVQRRHVREVVDNRLSGNGARNAFLAVVGVLFTYGRNHELCDNEPTKDIRSFKIGQHEPWPDDLLTAGLKADHDRTRLAINLLYYTGQRIGDVVKLKWTDIRDGVVYLTQQKTGTPLAIPLHSSLSRELERTPRRGETIISTYEGRPMTDQVVRRELKAFADTFDLKLVPHGLRKNAVNALLEAGATVPEVGAITGQSFNVVEHYARKVSKIKLSRAAMDKLENATGKFKQADKPASDSV